MARYITSMNTTAAPQSTAARSIHRINDTSFEVVIGGNIVATIPHKAHDWATIRASLAAPVSSYSLNSLTPTGTFVTVSTLSGYKMYQDRRFECRHGCKCDEHCDGIKGSYEAFVIGRVFWADNSDDLKLLLLDGTERSIETRAPNGDAC